MPVQAYRLKAHKRHQENLAIVGNDKDALVTLLVPVQRKSSQIIIVNGTPVPCESATWEYELQEHPRAMPPEQELARAKLEGRYRPDADKMKRQDGFYAPRPPKRKEFCFIGGTHPAEGDEEQIIPGIPHELRKQIHDSFKDKPTGKPFTINDDLGSKRELTVKVLSDCSKYRP
jgi:hypothetical protein